MCVYIYHSCQSINQSEEDQSDQSNKCYCETTMRHRTVVMTFPLILQTISPLLSCCLLELRGRHAVRRWSTNNIQHYAASTSVTHSVNIYATVIQTNRDHHMRQLYTFTNACHVHSSRRRQRNANTSCYTLMSLRLSKIT